MCGQTTLGTATLGTTLGTDTWDEPMKIYEENLKTKTKYINRFEITITRHNR